MKYYFLALGTFVIVCVGCVYDGRQTFDKEQYHAPPAAMMQHPGPMVGGPGPGVIPMLASPPPPSFAASATQVRFLGPLSMNIGWFVGNGYTEAALVAPGRYDFRQGFAYRLKLTDIPGREGLILYPTLQVYPAHPTTDAYLAHNSVPMELTDEDLDQIETNNFVTKVIYLPDARFQDLAIAGVETIVSTRLDPGVDPIAEADRRGTIMAVLRVGNMDLEMPGQPGAPTDIMPAALQEDGTPVPPAPVAMLPRTGMSIPGAQIVGGYGLPGLPAPNPIAGVGGVPSYGMPMTGTPIGLAGPPHIPLGGPASLKSHTVRNLSDNDLPRPVRHMLVDVEHEPGLSLPEPVGYIKYSEKHPSYSPGETSYPAWAGGGPGMGGTGMGYCPPGTVPPQGYPQQ